VYKPLIDSVDLIDCFDKNSAADFDFDFGTGFEEHNCFLGSCCCHGIVGLGG
jgi:hypothetical protein